MQLSDVINRKIIRCTPAQPLVKRRALLAGDGRTLYLVRLRCQTADFKVYLHDVILAEHTVCFRRLTQAAVAVTVQTIVIAVMEQENMQLRAAARYEIPVASGQQSISHAAQKAECLPAGLGHAVIREKAIATVENMCKCTAFLNEIRQ